MTLSIAYALLVVGFVTIGVLFVLIRQGIELRRVAGAIKNSTAEIVFAATTSDPPLFPVRSEMGKHANRFVDALRLADQARRLDQFDVERQTTPLALRLRSMGGSARAIAGLLILVALVTTLLNLQGAVSELGDTFRDLASRTKTESRQPDRPDVVDTVQHAMGNVATRAATAFLLSGVSVGCAVLLLIASLGVQRESQWVLRNFIAWAHGVQSERLIQKTGPDEGQVVDFSGVVIQFQALVKSFGNLGADLGHLGEFRTELNNAVSAISSAVEKLPAAIQANMTTLSSQVTSEIAADLNRQYTILDRLLAAYGDLGLKIKHLQEFTERVTEQHGEAAAALVKLGTLPEDTRELAAAVSDLTRKTAAIGTMDFKSTQEALNTLRSELAVMYSSLKEFRARTKAAEDAVDETLKGLLARTDRLDGRISNTRDEYTDTLRAEISIISKQLRDLQGRGFFDLFRGGGRGSSAS